MFYPFKIGPDALCKRLYLMPQNTNVQKDLFLAAGTDFLGQGWGGTQGLCQKRPFNRLLLIHSMSQIDGFFTRSECLFRPIFPPRKGYTEGTRDGTERTEGAGDRGRRPEGNERSGTTESFRSGESKSLRVLATSQIAKRLLRSMWFFDSFSG